MSFLPVGRRRPMQTQMFRVAQGDLTIPDLDSDYMSGDNIPVDFQNQNEQEIPVDKPVVTEEDLKAAVFSELEGIGVPSRIVREKQDSIFGQTLKSDSSLSGFFLIPTFTAEGKVSLSTATDLAKKISSQFGLDWQIEEVNNNYRVKFETATQEVTPESSFDMLGGKTSKTASAFSELLEERKNLLYNKLRDLK
jgi:hypothetical protein